MVRNLVKGNAVVIDGMKGKVTCNGVNKFGDVEIWEFPKLKVAENNLIIMEKEKNDFKIEYRELLKRYKNWLKRKKEVG